jgi:Mycothiol maleylpyruvate isomerase N-terminal domain
MDRPYIAENNRERARLRALVDRLSDGDLARSLDAGWTVGALLAHLAFWDQRILALIERWEKEGLRSTPRSIDGKDVDWINDSAKALCLALSPRDAARLAVATADAVDRRVEALSDQHVAANAAAGNPISLVRAEHRREHLDEIERVFGPSRAR